MKFNPPSSSGPCRIADGVVLAAPNFCRAVVIMEVWTEARCSSLVAIAGRV